MQSLEVNEQNFASINWEDDYYKYCEFVDISTAGGHITSDFANCTFRNVEWYWGIFNIVNFVDCIFVNCVFRGTSFPDCKFVACEIQGCRFIKDNLDGDCTFEGAVAYNCKVSNSEGFPLNCDRPI
ncbi:MAG: pentapeptide repeat-containing protein [Pyrinomonadaceae bacterium]|nr:pentapeptide repeat-containing protein [Pyrinomonadaceae bacterium]MBP6211620.1 pentapeptide repeat-containing protein [Pyrinomonadaceae bacterium]